MNSYWNIVTDDPLFCNNKIQTITAPGHIFIFQRINDKAEFGYRNSSRRFFTSHQLRAMFISTLYMAGLDKLAINWMADHKINEIDEAYFKVDPEYLKSKYIEALEHLTLEKVKIKKVTTPEYDALINKLTKKDEETENLKTELNEVKDAFGKMVDLLLNEQKEEFNETREELINALKEIRNSKK